MADNFNDGAQMLQAKSRGMKMLIDVPRSSMPYATNKPLLIEDKMTIKNEPIVEYKMKALVVTPAHVIAVPVLEDVQTAPFGDWIEGCSRRNAKIQQMVKLVAKETNAEALEEIAITTVNAECSAIIMNKVPEKLEDPGKFLIPCALQELDRTSALADSGASINLLPHSIYKKLGLEALTPTRMTLELANRSISHPMGIAEDVVVRVDGFTFLADFVVVNFEPDPRVPIILGRPFLRTAKALIDLYEEKLTLRVGKDELVYYADKSEKNKDKNCVHAISIIDFSKEDPFSGSTTNSLHPSSSPVKTSDNFEKFTDELAPLNSLPPGNDDSTLKKEFHEVNFQVYSNPLFEFDESFKSSNVNPLFEEKDKDVEIKFSTFVTLTSPQGNVSIPPGIDLTIPSIFEVSSSNPTSPTLTGEKVCSWKTPMFFSLVRFVWKMMTRIAIRKKIMCILATYLHKKPKPLSQEVEEIKEKEDSDSPFTAELSASGYLEFSRKRGQSKSHQMASDHVGSDPGLQCSTTVLEQDSLSPGPQSQENVPQIVETVTTSNELELLYSPMFSALLNGNSPVMSKSSAVHAADNNDKR
ncbi:reverse transcriptase domain-containing protein [Tanacetum coccineum]|uniref:Reverse transcriptase domain-containing protein n=1 Tax=Tanacetum coccineum TaxID=301880 RepID=A0ABQ5GFU8_9ASTR